MVFLTLSIDMAYCAIDFGTSNSAVAVTDGDRIALASVEKGATTLPTAIFFNSDDHTHAFGRAALAAYIDGFDGRLMRAIKSILGTGIAGIQHGLGRWIGNRVSRRDRDVRRAPEELCANAPRRADRSGRARPPGVFRRRRPGRRRPRATAARSSRPLSGFSPPRVPVRAARRGLRLRIAARGRKNRAGRRYRRRHLGFLTGAGGSAANVEDGSQGRRARASRRACRGNGCRPAGRTGCHSARGRLPQPGHGRT